MAVNACIYMKMSEKLGQATLRIKSSVIPNYEKTGNQQRKFIIFPEEEINNYALNKPVDCDLYCILRTTVHDKRYWRILRTTFDEKRLQTVIRLKEDQDFNYENYEHLIWEYWKPSLRTEVLVMLSFNVSHWNKIETVSNITSFKKTRAITEINSYSKRTLNRIYRGQNYLQCWNCADRHRDVTFLWLRLVEKQINEIMIELAYRLEIRENTDHRRFDNVWLDLDRTWQNKIMEGLLRRKQFAYSTDYKQLLCKNPVRVCGSTI